MIRWSCIHNTYDASASTGVPTEFSLTKVFEGKTWTTEDVFEFTLTAGENTAGIETPMPANPTVQVNAPTEEDGKQQNLILVQFLMIQLVIITIQ